MAKCMEITIWCNDSVLQHSLICVEKKITKKCCSSTSNTLLTCCDVTVQKYADQIIGTSCYSSRIDKNKFIFNAMNTMLLRRNNLQQLQNVVLFQHYKSICFYVCIITYIECKVNLKSINVFFLFIFKEI